VPADRPRSVRYEVDVEVETRRRLGLPREVLEQAGVEPGDRVHVQVRRDGRIVLTRVGDLLGTYVGAIPGIAAAARPPEPER
jgi:bifunctional DNA-binding transcriptional regulator/antitoxin component of YhaV-PrlF toxin-antitoxin module